MDHPNAINEENGRLVIIDDDDFAPLRVAVHTTITMARRIMMRITIQGDEFWQAANLIPHDGIAGNRAPHVAECKRIT